MTRYRRACCARSIVFGGSEYAVEMHATMVEFARMQKGRHVGMQRHDGV